MAQRKICVVTGTRAEYGLLYWLMKEIDADPDLTLQLIVTAMHLSPEFGLTCKTIEQDGFVIQDKIEMLLSSDTPVGIAKSIGLATIGFAESFARLKPDILVLLGDRYEMLAAAQAALVAQLPVAHIHGGEMTEGAFDDAIRHSITKMAHIHFVAAEPYRMRVIQLGEQPDYVFNYGAPGLDHLSRTPLLGRTEFEQSIDFELGELNFLVTYHPVTIGHFDPQKAIHNLFTALDTFQHAKVIITQANSDPKGRELNNCIEQYARERSTRVKVIHSLGQVRYFSAMRHVDVLIGNSSSGLIEAPFFKKPTVNIGDRQRGRLKAQSVIDCTDNAEEIRSAIERALSIEFRQTLSHTVSPYGAGDTSKKIKEKLKEINLGHDQLVKRFYDL